MYRLRKKRPPFGTADAPIMEYAYAEQVKVVDGFCEVHDISTRDYLLKMGYEEVTVEELETVAPSENGHQESDVPVVRTTRRGSKRKGRR